MAAKLGILVMIETKNEEELGKPERSDLSGLRQRQRCDVVERNDG